MVAFQLDITIAPNRERKGSERKGKVSCVSGRRTNAILADTERRVEIRLRHGADVMFATIRSILAEAPAFADWIA